ncbi:hypothetical protein G6010_04295 [Dietzia sp. SLG510A3-3B2-2]|nr:hypothetical protein [Dietzia sp. SLG510A3-3B2-2]
MVSRIQATEAYKTEGTHYFRRAKADQLLFGDEYPYVQAIGESLTAR